MSFVLRSLQVFVVVAEELHFGRAAARLHMTQPPLSQQIRELEHRLGTALFVRTTRSVQLTDAGKVLLDRARRLLADSDAAVFAVRRAAAGEVGNLALGFVNSTGHELLPKVIAKYRRKFPEVNLELKELISGDLLEALLTGRIDVALVRATSSMKSPGLEFFTIMRERMLLALPAEHELARLRRVPLRRLDGVSFVGYDPVSARYFREITEDIFKAEGVRPRVVCESLLPTVLALVEANVGVAIVPASMSRMRNDRLVYSPLWGVGRNGLATLDCARRCGDINPLVDHFVRMVRSLVESCPS
jgi:DNA-binding transcriptional LysR family regulator